MVYEYKEYPKWIKDKNGKDIIVENSMEEEQHKATIKVKEAKEEKKKSNEKGWN